MIWAAHGPPNRGPAVTGDPGLTAVRGSECAQDARTLVSWQYSGKGRVLTQLDGQCARRCERLQDGLRTSIEDGLPGSEPVAAHAGWVGTPEALEIGLGVLKRTNRVGREVARHRSVEPERLPLVSVEARL